MERVRGDSIISDESGYADDVLIHDVEFVHIERMDTGHVWMGLYCADGRRYWVNFTTPRNGRLLWLIERDN